MATTPSFSGNSEHLPYDRGTIERINQSLLSSHLRHSLRDGELTAEDFAKWLSEPWTAIKFLEGRVSTKKDSKEADPGTLRKIATKDTAGLLEDMKAPLEDLYRKFLGKTASPDRDVLLVLREWGAAADEGAEQRDAWEKSHVAEKHAADNAVRVLHSILSPSVDMYQKTEKDLRAAKGLNFIENGLRGTKEFLIDDFWEHPEMSVLLVLTSVMAYKSLFKGTKIWTVMKYAGGAAVAATFLKKQFGIEPTEKLAEFAEHAGMKPVAEGLRGFRDTVHRGLFGAEKEGTINGYFYEHMELQNDERVAFNTLLEQNPKKFIAWYNAATRWQMDRGTKTTSVPSEVGDLVREMTKGSSVPSHFKKMPMAKRAEILFATAEKVFSDIARTNGKRANPSEGLAIVMQKYVDGSYFRILWDQFDAFCADIETKYTAPKIKEQIKRIRDAGGDFYKGMERKVQNGSDIIQFLDVLVMETDIEVLQKFQGPGMSMNEFFAVLEDVKGKLGVLGGDLKDKGEEAWKDISRFFGETVPDYWKDAWPKLKKVWEDTRDYLWEDAAGRPGPAKDAYDWLFSPSGVDSYSGTPLTTSRLERAIEDAKKAGKNTVTLILNSRAVALLEQIGVNAGDAITMTMKEAEEMTVWLQENAKMQKALQTFTARKDSSGELVWSLGGTSPSLLDGYLHLVHVTLIVEPDPTFMGTRGPPPLVAPLLPVPFTPPVGALPFSDAIIIEKRVFPPLTAGYRYRRAEIMLEIQDPTGTMSRKSKTQKVAL